MNSEHVRPMNWEDAFDRFDEFHFTRVGSGQDFAAAWQSLQHGTEN